MVDITQADVIDFAPELATVSESTWERILAYVNELDMTGVGETEATTMLARLYLAAHMATTTKRGSSASAGPVTSESVGGVRRSYANVAATSASSLSSTRYGQMYSEVLNASLASCPVVV